ncbi:carboxymuconolactone decarboxylase family protein [Roseomonas sp. CAU 1739]|uniref:carboxymuconolactone decarboxylase family protein n=1 Tax=Roseomonas sp. CAU 1739 TaxID=3140364 RepID=UPI00325C2B28
MTTDPMAEHGPWSSAALSLLREWDPDWVADCERMTRAAWQAGGLTPRVASLVALAVACASTALDGDGTRRHIAAALASGATRAEVLTVLKMAALLSIHTCSVGAPILLEEAKAAGLPEPVAPVPAPATPACEGLRAAGQWNSAWDPFYQLDPAWTDAFMATGGGIYLGGIEPKLAELLSIAFDASIRHLYAPGIRRHIRAALGHGATVAEVMGVLQICVAQGVQALNAGVPILAEALAHGTESARP